MNIAVLIGYLIFSEERTAWTGSLVAWAWIPFLAHVILTNFLDGVQNTTRNIARIYLLKTDGLTYDQNLAGHIQKVLIPHSTALPTIFWQLASILSFATLLLFQGWLPAVGAHVTFAALGGFLPLRPQSHLRRIQDNLENSLDPREISPLLARGVSVLTLHDLVSQAIEERRDPQEWWGEVMHDATQEAVAATNQTSS